MRCNPAKGRVEFVDGWLIKSSFITKDEMKACQLTRTKIKKKKKKKKSRQVPNYQPNVCLFKLKFWSSYLPNMYIHQQVFFMQTSWLEKKNDLTSTVSITYLNSFVKINNFYLTSLLVSPAQILMSTVDSWFNSLDGEQKCAMLLPLRN